jgi:hypothetical protein
VNPLAITSRFGKLLDTILADNEPITHMRFRANFTLQISESTLQRHNKLLERDV